MRGGRPQVDVGPRERVLAWATTVEGIVLVGTRDAFYECESDTGWSASARIPWEQVQASDWDSETSVLRLSEVGTFGEQRPEHTWTLVDPGRLLGLLRERVTASVVYQLHVPVAGRRGLRVIARRAPAGDQPVRWLYEYDEGVDPDSPAVREAARTALGRARDMVGDA
ncbi:hypothetical protein [Nocardioides acrostichi]|uniref:Uncharacterized protein n=1 Tax=Nocardioides acrostichi TaxID=2784339 RepID=A0A930UYW1_9ACTN|nr:hypothetical protein [Nocardioides acrostichi]MBF4163423.1 hypothetical protein [Nocardioides acrostichi]